MFVDIPVIIKKRLFVMAARNLHIFCPWQTRVERNLLRPNIPDHLLQLTALRSQLLIGERIVKTEKGSGESEERINCVQPISLKEKSTECICPKCGARHRLKILWTGRGKPRKLCPICKHYANTMGDTDPFVVSNIA